MDKHWIEARIDELKAQGRDVSKSGLAERLGINPARISEMLRGDRRLQQSEYETTARYLEMQLDDVARAAAAGKDYVLLAGSRGMATKLQRFQPKVGAFNTDAAAFLRREGLAEDSAKFLPDARFLLVPIVGEVEAGAWREADDGAVTPGETIRAYEDPRFPGLQYIALRVRGNSMNMRMPHGSVAICVSYIHLESQPISGEYVVVQRRKANGLTEATIKQYMVENGRRLLYPRSHDPRHQEPVSLDGLLDDEEIVISARVIDVIQQL